MKILIIDDIQEVLFGAEQYLKKIILPCELFYYPLNVKDDDNKIKMDINNFNADVIFSDRTFRLPTVEKDFVFVDQTIKTALQFIDCFKNRDVVIYTYNRWNTSNFYNNWKQEHFLALKKNCKKNKFYIETSNYFSRLPGEGLYEEYKEFPREGLIKVGNIENVKAYGFLIGTMVEEYFNKFNNNHNKTGTQFFDDNSISFNKSHSLLNEIISKIGYKLGTISFFSDKVNDYLLDMPNKVYFTSLNESIEKNGYLKSLIHEGVKTVYYKYFINENTINVNCIQIELKNKDGKLECIVVKQDQNNNEFKLYKAWLVFLHYGVFFIKEDEYNWDEIITNVITNNSTLVNNSYIEIYWTYQNLKINENISGNLNYTFYRTNVDESSTFDIGFVSQVQNLYRRFIESFARESLFGWYENELQNQATRASISQVMARNGSHNFGSHVLSRVVEPFLEDLLLGHLTAKQLLITIKKYKEAIGTSELAEISTALDALNMQLTGLETQPEHRLSGIGNFFTASSYKPLPISDNDHQDPISLLATFISFQKSLMDFLADITFGEPALEVTKLFFSDIMASLDRNRIMLDFVSGSNYKYEFVVRNLNSCSNHEIMEKKYPHCGCVITGADNDIAVSLPNDILGSIAFYVILINFIRNAAKHGSRAGNQDCNQICIDILDEGNDQFYKIILYDDSAIETEKLTELVNNLNNKLSDNINQGGKLRSGAWGLIEMAAAAAYLRKEPLENINEQWRQPNTCKTEKPFLKAVKAQGMYLGYELYLLKPKELLVVYSDKNNILTVGDDLIKGLAKNGVALVDVDKIEGNKKYSFPLMLYIGSQTDWEKVNNTNLPIRKLVYVTDSHEPKHFESRFTHHLSNEEVGMLSFSPDKAISIINSLWKVWIVNASDYLNTKTFLNEAVSKQNLGRPRLGSPGRKSAHRKLLLPRLLGS